MKPRIGVVTRDAGHTWEMKALHRAARALGAELVRVDPKRASVDLVQGCLLDPDGAPLSLDIAIGRVDAGCLDDGVRLLECIAGRLPVINGAPAFRTGRDKRLMSRALARAGVPHPPTWLVAPAAAVRLSRKLPFPLVAKPPQGAGGDGVQRVARRQELLRLAAAGAEPLYLQAYCRGIQEELRVLVLDGLSLGAVRKRPRRDEWRANLALGGEAVPAPLDAEAERIAVRAAAAVGADFAGVDLVRVSGGLVVLEVNVCPGFRGFALATGVDVASHLIRAALARVTKEGGFRESAGPDAGNPLVQRA